MYGDFTRFTFDSKKHNVAVLKQQGRVDLDAEWNEHAEIREHLQRTTRKDVIGRCGVPDETKDGFKISVTTNKDDLIINPGRIYVDGILCELEEEKNKVVTYTSQPYYRPKKEYASPPHRQARTDLVYLDVWHRHITAIEDEDIKEVALGGPDTATRLRTVWQVKFLEDVKSTISCKTSPDNWDSETKASGGKLTTKLKGTSKATDPCVMSLEGGYRGLENRLYRVEIHKGGGIGEATFKWSRDNGSVLFAVDKFDTGDPKKVTVERLRRDQVLALRASDWVEVLDDDTEWRGEPGTLAKITNINAEDRILTLNKPVTGYKSAGNPKVRRWDQGKDEIKVATGPIDLEDGIQVEFSGSNFRTGDYWVFPARTATGDIELLKDEPPRGIKHHYCPLAMIKWDAAEKYSIEDCRLAFLPLTKIQPCKGAGGLCTITLGVDVKDLQEAVDQLPQEGGCICIPAVVSTELIFNQPRKVEIINRQAITIKGCGPASAVIYSGEGPLFTIENSEDITLRGFKIECEAQTQSALCLNGETSRYVRLEDCILSFKGIKAAVEVADNAKVVDLAIEHCRVEASTGPGVLIGNDVSLTALLILNNRLQVDKHAVESNNVNSLNRVRIVGNWMDRGLRFNKLPKNSHILVLSNYIVSGDNEGVRVDQMEEGAHLLITENTIEAQVGIGIKSIGAQGSLVLDENHVTTVSTAVRVESDDGEIHANANIFSSASAPAIVIGEHRREDNILMPHILFSNNQLYSTAIPTNGCTVKLGAHRLVVMGNYISDGRVENGSGVSICLPDRETIKAATVIGNATGNNIEPIPPVSDTNVVILNNAVFK